MIVELNREIIKKLTEYGVDTFQYVLLLTLQQGEYLFEDTYEQVYKDMQYLILEGFVIENFTDEPELYNLTSKGEKLLEEIENI